MSSKGKEPFVTPTPVARKPPVVMIRTGKPSPEIIRSEKENTDNMQQRKKYCGFSRGQFAIFKSNFHYFGNPKEFEFKVNEFRGEQIS